MKRGYKETEIGEIPEEWDIKPLEDIGTTYTGLSGKTKSDFGSGFPYVPFMNINRNSHVDENFFDYVMLSEGEVQNTVEYGDILFTTSSETPDEVGMSSVVLCKIPKLYLNSFSFGFRPNKSTNLFPKYSEYIFRGKKSREQIEFLGQGSTRYNISKNQLLKMYIPLPPLTEQKKIAEILSSVDESIRATQAVIEQAKVLKQGMLNQLLTKGIGHKKFKQTEIGEIPEDWEVVELRSCGDWKGGGTPSKIEPQYWENGTICWVSSLEVKEQYLQNTTYKITEKAVAETTATLIPKDSLLMVMRSGILAHTFPVSMTLFPLAINQDIKALIPNSDFNSYYLLSLLEKLSPKILKECVKSGTTVQSVEFDWLKSIQIPKPSLAEQKKIGEKMKYIDDSMAHSRNTLTQLARIKSGLMQDLLSGKKRVKV